MSWPADVWMPHVCEGANKAASGAVAPSEGDEARCEGRRESEHPDSTDEDGERHSNGPGGGKRDVESWNRRRETR